MAKPHGSCGLRLSLAGEIAESQEAVRGEGGAQAQVLRHHGGAEGTQQHT